MNNLDPESTLPLHNQIARHLAAAIAAGDWPVGGTLPSEPELARRFSVSRMTLRQALGALAEQGLLIRQRGRATRIAPEPIAQPLGQFYAFANEMDRRGLAHTSRVLSVGLAKPTALIRKTLELATGEQVAQISLLRMLDQEPVMIETASFNTDHLPTLERPEVAQRSLYDLLAESGVTVTRATEQIRPLAITATHAQILGVSARTLGFLVRRISYDEHGPIEVRESIVRGDRYYFVAELQRDDLLSAERRP
jgi:GntR family transcriptional regulator